MRIALAQMNPVIGDFEGNRARILAFAQAAIRLGVGAEPRFVAAAELSAAEREDASPLAAKTDAPELLVFPELALCGYPPMDLLDQESFVEASLASLRRLQRELPPGIAVAVGYVDRNRTGSGRPLFNAVAVIKDGEVVFSQAKTLLPTYDVFDEARYFEPARERRVFELGGVRIGFAICEDIWWEAPPVPGLRYALDPVKELFDAGAELLIVPSASPFTKGKLAVRQKLAGDAAREGGVPVFYCNALGGNDSLVFDGRSFALDAAGRPALVVGWEEGLLLADSASLGDAAGRLAAELAKREGSSPSAAQDPWEEVEAALVLGTRDYLRKCGFSSACLGISGGIDSALVAYIASQAVGSGNLTCLAMPSRFSSPGSIGDSAELCRRLGVRMETLPIEGPFTAYLELLEPRFEGRPLDLTEENLQARIRGAILMAWSNKFGSLLLTTGNKSELAAGYCTLYGDMCGAFNPIGDLLKTEIYALCRSINARAEASGQVAPIPRAIIEKAPSAELRPNQKDQDSLPPYEELDAVLELHLIGNLSAAEIVERGYPPSLVARVLSLVARSEYKRRQGAPVLKVSPRAFGTGRRIPIARSAHEVALP